MMRVLTSIVLCAFIMVLRSRESSGGNIILGTTSGMTGSRFDAGNFQSYYTNNNGIVELYNSYSSYEQKPDGSCIKKIVETKNGVTETKEIPIDCETAKQEIREHQEKTRKKMTERQKEIDKHREEMMKQHAKISQQIEESIRNMHMNFML